jgi:hypothetical protein
MRVLTRLSQSSISEQAIKNLAALDRRQDRTMDRVVEIQKAKQTQKTPSD